MLGGTGARQVPGIFTPDCIFRISPFLDNGLYHPGYSGTGI